MFSSKGYSPGRLWVLSGALVLSALSVFATEAQGAGAEAVDMTHCMMMLMLQLGALLFAARAGNVVFTRMQLPGVLGELSAGILIGPYALGRVNLPGFPRGLFPEFILKLADGGHEMRSVVSPELYGVCVLAAVVLLFLVGLETDLRLFMRYSLSGSLVGLGGVAVSFLCGDLLGVWLMPWIVPGTYTIASPASLFLGVMATATSVSMTARILSENKKLDSPEGVTILSGAVLDDVVGIILLAVGIGIVGLAGPEDVRASWGDIGLIACETVAFWLAATVIGVLSARKIGAGLKRLGGHSDVAVLALGLALIVAGLFEKAKLSMIIGSYAMGLSLSRTDISHMVREHLKPIFTLLVPIFFVVMGMMVDLQLLFTPKVLLFGLLYTALATFSKLAGCGLPALLCGFNVRGAVRIGLGMVPRGEVALVIAGVALSAGFISKEVFGVAVMMTLLTTLSAPPLMLAAFNRKGTGLRLGWERTAMSEAPPVVYSFPSEEVAQLLVGSLMTSLTQEGFFAHALDLGDGLYQARKEDLIINIRRTGPSISFEAPLEAEPVIRLMMIEVIVEFEQTLNELRKPLGADLHMELTDEELAGNRRRQTLAKFLDEEAMLPSLKGTSYEEIIGELVDVLASLGQVRDPAVALACALKREASMPTGLRHGIACPHARTDAVAKLVCAVGLKSEGVDFHSLDEQPTRVVLLTLCPAGGAAPYLEFMSSAMAVLHEEQTLKKLLGARTSGEMFRVLV